MTGGPSPRTARAASAVVMGIAVSSLIGWVYDIGPLKTVVPGFVTMKVNTALCLLACAFALFLQADPETARVRARWTRAASAFVAAIAVCTILEHIFKIDLGIDQLIIEAPPEKGSASPGRMAPATAVSFAVLSGALALLPSKDKARRSAVQLLAVAVLLNGSLAIVGYAIGERALYGLGSYTSPAVHTAFCFTMLGVGVLAARWRARPLRFLDWPLRAKMATLLVVTSLVPLAMSATTDIRSVSSQLTDAAGAVLNARGDQILWEIDGFHRTHLRSVEHLAAVLAVLQREAPSAETPYGETVLRTLQTRPLSDPAVRAAAIVDQHGKIALATDPRLNALDLSFHSYFRRAVQSATPSVSDVHIAPHSEGDEPTIAYLAPIRREDGSVDAMAVVWIRAAELWAMMKRSNELAGPGSFAVLFDDDGIRIAHTFNDAMMFRPGGPLPPETIATAVAERRFGARTQALLEDVKSFPEQFRLARAKDLPGEIFYGFAPSNQQWNYGVARRLSTAPWTVFYMLPEAAVRTRIVALVNDKAVFAAVVILAALVAGILFTVVIASPVRTLAYATERFAAGDLAARALTLRDDELGQLGEAFNRMAQRIESQAAVLLRSNEELEERVKQRTAALEASEQSLAITLNSIGDAVIATDTNARIERMNPVAERMTGWTFSEAREHPLADVFCIAHEETMEKVESPVARVLREGRVVGLAHHTVLESRDGNRTAIADSGAPIRDNTGKMVGVVLVFRDASVERSAQRALEQSEARKTAVLDSAFDAIVTMDHEGKLVEFNRAAERLFGYERTRAIGEPMVNLIVPPSLRDAHTRGFAKHLQTGEGPVLGRVIELPAMRSDGTEFPAELAINRVKDQTPPLFTAFIRDVTERRHMEENVRRNQKRFRALVEASSQIVWTASASGQVVEDSPSWRAFTGQSAEDYLSDKRREAIHPDDYPRVRAEWEKAARERRQLSDEYRLRHTSGEWRWTAFRVVPLIGADGAIQEWVGMSIDITAEKNAQLEREDLLRQLRSLNAELEERVESRTSDLTAALKEREVLLQEIHHRVKNNLQVVSSLINIQMRQMTDTAGKAALEECRTRIAAIALIHEKLYQTKDYASVPFSEYARNLAANIFHATGTSPSSVTLRVDVEKILLPVDKAIPCGLILNELITNALKHAFPENRQGEIHVELRTLDHSMLLAVADDGVGMPTGFETAKSKSLGMQLVSTLVRQLDGQLQTVRDHGTAFRITFPLEAVS